MRGGGPGYFMCRDALTSGDIAFSARDAREGRVNIIDYSLKNLKKEKNGSSIIQNKGQMHATFGLRVCGFERMGIHEAMGD